MKQEKKYNSAQISTQNQTSHSTKGLFGFTIGIDLHSLLLVCFSSFTCPTNNNASSVGLQHQQLKKHCYATRPNDT
ncbi:hypothetical protein QTN47_12610 [Danxiaibacter flavus]|uniref:Uncharacterized protein n=1 Tax=Danxiaibacter flavus TaxID=3049108 RepID=A0ABV3ZEP7_9BACT|nr:hypothetical protein QNM32_12615 [Chitinophagaceae bacterium DXS]